ncbi:MAG: glycosyltransferase family 2 protein [Ignavibacteria bacterium]
MNFLKLTFQFRKVNDGFGCGCNFGAGIASGNYLLFLNPDIILLDDSVLELAGYLKNNPDSGITSGLMVDENRSVLYSFNEFPSFEWEFYQLIGFGYKQKIENLVSKKEIKENIIFETDWFHGAVFMIRKSDFEKSGGFNEEYFMYYEDVEICFNMKTKSDKKNVCLPSVRVFHHTRSSLGSESNDNIYMFHIHRSKIIFLRNYPVLKGFLLKLMGILYTVTRLAILPFWLKYKGQKKNKSSQLFKILKLYLSSSYVDNSKYEYIKS